MNLFFLSLLIVSATASNIASDCSGSQSGAIEEANKACAKLANAAAEAAESGDENLFNDLFKTTDQSTRREVAESYRKVARECGASSGKGCVKSFCSDDKNYCNGDLLAYTLWKEQNSERSGETHYCPRYFELEAASSSCGEQSQGSNTLHETTHAVLATEDITYGLDNCKQLSSDQALKNADSYTFYAIAVDIDCTNDDGSGAPSYNAGGSGGGSNGQSGGNSEGDNGSPPSYSDGKFGGSGSSSWSTYAKPNHQGGRTYTVSWWG
ncbi:hypothetical protein Q7P37_000350 [Cladosporium fusiforme]